MVVWDMRKKTEMIYSLFILFTSCPAEDNLGSVYRVTNTKWLDGAGSMQTVSVQLDEMQQCCLWQDR